MVIRNELFKTYFIVFSQIRIVLNIQAELIRIKSTIDDVS